MNMRTSTTSELDRAIASEDNRDPVSGADEYEPTYDFGVASYTKYPGGLEDIDSELSLDSSASAGESTRAWDRERIAARDAWDHVSTRR